MKGLIAACLLLLALPSWATQNLLETYDQAVHNAPRLATAQAQLGAARARYRQARGQLLPQVSASARYTRTHEDQRYSGVSLDERNGGLDSYAATVELSQPLLNWSAWQNMDAAQARSKRARVLLSAAEQDLIVRTVQAYFNVLAARDQLVATQEELAAIRRQLDRAQAAFQAGLAPVTDKQEAQSSLDAAQADLIAARNQLGVARDKLRALTGRAPVRLASIAVHEPTSLDANSQRSRKDWLRVAQHNATSSRAARARLQAAHQEVAAAHGRRYPDIALVGSIGRSERALPMGGSGGSTSTTQTWSVGVRLQMPLFAGGSIGAAVAEAHYKVAQARSNLIQTRRQLRLNVNSAWRDAHAAADRVDALDQAITSARTALKAAKSGYRLGNRTILDVIEASTEVAQRKAERKQAWYDYALARLRLRRAAGVLGHAALARINTHLAAPSQTADATMQTAS